MSFTLCSVPRWGFSQPIMWMKTTQSTAEVIRDDLIHVNAVFYVHVERFPMLPGAMNTTTVI
jgi:hypothetical protein